MKRWKKVLLVLLGIIILSQLPFAYRRYRLGRLHDAILNLQSQRVTDQTQNACTDYRGVIHVHSMLGGHSTGNFTDIIRAANQNALSFVVMTEHPAKEMDTALMTLNGMHEGVLFIGGSEISAANGDRLLLIPGNGAANANGMASTQEIISQEKSRGGISFIAYPQEFKSWDASDYDGIEVYNLFTNSKKINPLVTFFDGLWSYRSYPALLFATFYQRPNENLKKWDELTSASGRKLVATAGNDAHANVGLFLGTEDGKKLLGIKLDPYERSFQTVRTHLLIEKDKQLSALTLLEALRTGHCYISFDLFSDPTGFYFKAENGSEQKMMGDEISLAGGVHLTATTPLKTRIALIKDGQTIQEAQDTTRLEFNATQKGVYRIEAYLDQLPKPANGKLWIISNPIYVR
ncbi:MAG: hypothetical protein WBP93_19715 [Pyrinomonadaceae bacterium]